MAKSANGQKTVTLSGSLVISALLVSSYFFKVCAQDGVINEEIIMGIAYGQVADNLPPPSKVVTLISSMKIGKVRLYDANSDTLNALANTGIPVAISVTSNLIAGMAADCGVADQWILNNVQAYPNTVVRYIIVGNELFSDQSQAGIWNQLLPAMQCLHGTLLARGLSDSVKVTTAMAMDVLSTTYPPSAGVFRNDIAIPLVQPILQFISSTNSFFFINVYPYIAWANNNMISLNYALFATGSDQVIVTDGPYTYTNLLDAQMDALIAAMESLGYGSTNIAIGESGWPSKGDPGQLGTSLGNAANYNRRLVRKALANPAVGTPRRPGYFFPTFIFSLFNEDLKAGPTTERNWGLLNADTTAVYPIDLTGQLPDSAYPPLPT